MKSLWLGIRGSAVRSGVWGGADAEIEFSAVLPWTLTFGVDKFIAIFTKESRNVVPLRSGSIRVSNFAYLEVKRSNVKVTKPIRMLGRKCVVSRYICEQRWCIEEWRRMHLATRSTVIQMQWSMLSSRVIGLQHRNWLDQHVAGTSNNNSFKKNLQKNRHKMFFFTETC